MTVDYGAARKLFLAALEQTPADRDEFLKSQCAGDSALLAEVRSLLDFHDDDTVDRPVQSQLQVGDRFADRYRILRRIGRGGMGDVYHAHDEVLNESVALKRLTSHNESLTDALLNEVRLARRVTHPRICRVYDLGEWHGEHFITMEFVDGEDLGKLLRRVGRLPSERVAEMAREFCVGLAAAHGKGVLHRDLKPANILVDFEGHVHITDFGIAANAGGSGTSALTGTPSYMAPEQLIPGGSSTEQSDIYALGLVLHEMLTGKPVFPGRGLADVLTSRRQAIPNPPSQIVADVLPELDHAVVRMLQLDPLERPASALELAALLPGGDPLLVALEANTTPSPDLVAKAPGYANLSTSRSTAKLVALGVLLVIAFVLADLAVLFPIGANASHREVSEHGAVEFLRSLGYDAGGGAASFRGYIQDPTAPPGQASLLFWYRENHEPNRTSFQRTVLDPAAALTIYPETTAPKPDNLITVFDSAGELVYFQGFLPEASRGESPIPTDWVKILASVGLDSTELTPVTREQPPAFATDWAAWRTADSQSGSPTQRVDAAVINGHLTYFSRGSDGDEVLRRLDERLGAMNRLIINAVLIPIVFVVAIVFLVRNIRARRVDGSGTIKLVGAVAVLSMAKWLLLIDHMYHPLSDHSVVLWSSWNVPIASVSAALFYMALEPVVRRVWPQTLIAWTRVLHRDIRSSIVGQSILIGSVAGSLCGVIYIADLATPQLVDTLELRSIDHGPRLLAALGLRETVAVLLRNASDAIGRGVIVLFVFTMFRSSLDRPALATVLFVVAIAVPETAVAHHKFSFVSMGVPIGIVTAWVLLRAGLLASVVTGFVYASIRAAPITLDLDAWWALSGFAIVSVVFLLGVLGARLSTTPGVRPPLPERIAT